MLMHRSCLRKVYSGYLLNGSIAIIPWHFSNMNYMQWSHLKKNKYCHIVGVLGLETIKARNSMWLITKCKQILSESRHHYLIVWSWSSKLLCFSCSQLCGYFTKWISVFIRKDLVRFKFMTTSRPDFHISAEKLVILFFFFMHISACCCTHKCFAVE